MTEFSKAFVTAQKEMGPSPKFDKVAKAGNFQYEYVSLGGVLQHVIPICNKYGLSVSQEDVCINDRQFVKTTLEHVSGEKREFFNPFCGAYSKPQEYGSAYTYTRRYALYGIFGLYGETDTDAQEVGPQEAKKDKTVLIGKISRTGDPERRVHALEYYKKKSFSEMEVDQLEEVLEFLSKPRAKVGVA